MCAHSSQSLVREREDDGQASEGGGGGGERRAKERLVDHVATAFQRLYDEATPNPTSESAASRRPHIRPSGIPLSPLPLLLLLCSLNFVVLQKDVAVMHQDRLYGFTLMSHIR